MRRVFITQRPDYVGGEAAKDLRGATVRAVSRDDVVVISGAEYLRKSRLAREAERQRERGGTRRDAMD